jgi:beta-barrel assembly-enhancing protease
MKQHGLIPPEIENKQLARYMQSLGEKIGQNSDLHVPIKVTVLDSDEINAFALPGGYLYVNTGLINKADSENELVGVMAHEIAHAAARHGARLMKKASIASLLFQGAQIAAMVATGGAVGPLAYYGLQYGFYGLGMIIDLSLLGVSRDYESEADQLGAQYAWKAGYDPKGFITFFDKMASEEGYVRSASFFRTHPAFLERMLSTFSEITYLPPKRDLRLTSSAFDDAKRDVTTVIADRKERDKNAPSLRGMPEGGCGDMLKPISNN